MPTRIGLLVGVDHYPHFPPKNQLSSCVRDVEVIAEILEDRFAFRRQDLERLHDSQATLKGLRAALQDLVKRARPDDQVVFFFSGHGSWIGDPSRPTGRAATLVPHDSGRQSYDPPSENRDLRDDELYGWMLELSSITPYVTVILDSCRAAGALRDDPVGAQRKGLPGEPAPESRAPTVLRGTAGFRETGPSGWLPLSERYVLLAGCRSGQACFVHDLRDGSKQSAFTFFLAKELLNLTGRATYRDVGERLQPAISAQYPAQTPQVEGARNRVLFGVKTLIPRPYLSIGRQEGETVVLGGGAVHGVTVESKWAVHAPGTRRTEKRSALARLTVTAVHATEAEGHLEGHTRGATQLPAGCRAFELERRLSLTLPVVVRTDEATSAADGADPLSGHQTLVDQIARSSLLTLANEGAPGRAWTIRLGQGSSPPCWEILSPDGEPQIKLEAEASRAGKGVSDCEPAAVLEVLEAFARRQHVLELEPPEVTPALQNALKVELFRRRPSAVGPKAKWHTAEPEADGPPVFRERDEIGLRIHNCSELPLYLHVLDLGLSGLVSLLYPFPGRHRALPEGRVEEVGLHPGEELEVSVPEGFVGEQGLERFKIFATTHETDLSFLGTEGTLVRELRDRSPLERLLGAAWARAELREDEIAQPAVEDSWVTARVEFRVQREAH